MSDQLLKQIFRTSSFAKIYIFTIYDYEVDANFTFFELRGYTTNSNIQRILENVIKSFLITLKKSFLKDVLYILV